MTDQLRTLKLRAAKKGYSDLEHQTKCVQYLEKKKGEMETTP